MATLTEHRSAEPGRKRTERLIEQLTPLVKPLRSDADLDPLLARIGDARYVLLGEASHGTSEYYTWRMRISQRLIREKGFRFIAVEGDWPDCYRINRYVKHDSSERGGARSVLEAFDRWPTWMWANREVETLAEWLREHNQALPEARRVGFYGLDVYSLWDSMRAVIAYLDREDAGAARRARNAYECFAPYREDEQEYARATALVPTRCEDEVVLVLADLRRRASERGDRSEAHFDAEQNALIAKNAELYYRTMVRGGAASWNIRDSHMFETLERLMALHGGDAKCIVWAHNTHVGDSRHTDMVDEGEYNIGQLVREKHDGDAVLVGFGSYRGSVIAGASWGERMQRMAVPPGRPQSYEDILRRTVPGLANKLVCLWDAPETPELLERRGHRAIGVVYRPEYEVFGNYVPTVLSKRYDAMLFCEETKAVAPLHAREPGPDHDVPETFPFGV